MRHQKVSHNLSLVVGNFWMSIIGKLQFDPMGLMHLQGPKFDTKLMWIPPSPVGQIGPKKATIWHYSIVNFLTVIHNRKTGFNFD